MAQQLAYVIITPYTLHKSRTGGILARLITRTGLELAAARMFAPSAELVQKYSDVIISTADPQDRRIQELIRDYILRNLGPDPKTKRPRRAMMPAKTSGEMTGFENAASRAASHICRCPPSCSQPASSRA